MLPFDNRPWAKTVAKLVIAATILLELVVYFWLRRYGPLDIPEILALVLFAIAMIPPNIHVIRGKSYYADGRSGGVRGRALPVHK